MNHSGLLDKIQLRLPPGWSAQRSPDVDRLYSFIVGGQNQRFGVQRFHFLYGNLENLARSVDLDELLDRFEFDVNTFIAKVARNRFFVHAGVVGWKGRAIVIPGRSYSGKTILVKEFLEYGATYYSDEFAVFDRRGHVHPFPRPLGIRDRSTQRQIKSPTHDLPCKLGARPLPVGLLLLTHYRRSAQWRRGAISAGRGLLGLLANSLSARERPEETLTSFQRAVQGATVLSGARGEAVDLVRAILQHGQAANAGNDSGFDKAYGRDK